MCFWHVVASGSFDSPNVCSTIFTWDAVYAKVSGLDILDQPEHVDVFLDSNVDSLGAIVSMQPADLLEFRYCYGSKAAMLVGSYCVPVACFSGQGLDILMTTTYFLLTSNTYRIKKS
jgi:hypothetical protein